MPLNYRNLTLGIAFNFLLLTAPYNYQAQTKQTENPLAEFEKSIKQGNIAEIERPLLSYAIANPNDTKALKLLAQIRFKQGRLAESKGLYQRVLTLAPNEISSKISLARIAYSLGQKQEAQAILNEINTGAAASVASPLELSAAFFSVGELQKASTIAERLPVKVKNTDALPLLAAIYLETNDRSKLNALIPLMKKATVNMELASQCAEILQNAGLYKDAADVLRAKLVSATANAAVLTQLGRLEVYTRDFAQAQQHLDRANKLQPNSAEILSTRALLETAQGNLPAAYNLLNEARKIAPNSLIVLADFVVLAIRSNQSQAAVEAARNLVELNAENAEYKYWLGAALLQNGSVNSAEGILADYVKLRPNDSRGCLALGLTFAAQRDKIEDARQQLNRCLEIDPKNYEAKYQLGLSYKAQGESPTAIRYFEETVQLAPNYAPVLRDLGALYLQAGAEAKAQTVLEKSVALNPNDADTHFQLSRYYNLAGKSELARQHLEMFQKIRNGGKVSP
jgi:tetratricopeptide (TPR) repeat protein